MKAALIAVASAITGAVLSLTLVGSAQTVRTPSSVAYISGNRILRETTYGRAEAARVQQIQQRRATELRSKQQALESTRRQLASTSDAQQRATLIDKEQQERTDFERSTQQVQAELQTLQRDVNSDMQTRVKAALDDMMKTQGYQLVINSDLVLFWSTPELDLTPAVIGRLNGQ